MHRLVIPLVAIALALPHISAQSRKIAFRTLCLDYVDDIRKVVLPGESPGEGQEVPLYTDISPVVEGSFRNAKATFFAGQPDSDAKPVAVGQLAKSKRQLFVFVPNAADRKEGEPAYSVMCYDDDTGSFGMGQVRAINLAPVPVRFQISGQTTPQIPAGKFARFPHSKKTNKYNMYPVVVEFLSGNGEWIKGQSVSWKATNRRREVVVTLIDPKFKQPVVRMYSDFPEWIEPDDGELKP